MNGKIPFFGTVREFKAHQYEIMGRIEQVLTSGQTLQGKAISALEDRIASLVARKHAVAVNSCTDALYFALLAGGIRSGDEVLVTDFSFIPSASCIMRIGAVPVFVDVDETYNMDLQKAAALITTRTKAVVFVHLYGHMSDPNQVESFAREHNLVLIEDAAQAFGASFNGRSAGSLGLASCFSFDPTKPISAPGSGGIVLTDDSAVADRLRRLRYHGKAPDGQFAELGYNSQMPTLTAAVLDHKIDCNDQWLARRRRVARYYCDYLSNLDLRLPLEQPGAVHIYHKFVVRTSQRDAMKTHLEQHGIQTMVHYALPLHRQPCFARLNSNDTLYTKAVSFAQTVLSLPIHPFLEDSEVEHIAETLRNFSWRQRP